MRIAVLTVSDRCSAGLAEDKSGPLISALLSDRAQTAAYRVVPDERELIEAALTEFCDVLQADFVFTTGGTGFAPRDVTPEATLVVVEKQVPGIPEAMRAASLRITPRGMLSRSVAGIRGHSLIVNLPGSPKAALENLEPVLPAILHGLKMLRSDGPNDCAARQPDGNEGLGR
jgi:molybdenum cofactor synthesis domain-containing protein